LQKGSRPLYTRSSDFGVIDNLVFSAHAGSDRYLLLSRLVKSYKRKQWVEKNILRNNESLKLICTTVFSAHTGSDR
jgi:hypothetical protein